MTNKIKNSWNNNLKNYFLKSLSFYFAMLHMKLQNQAQIALSRKKLEFYQNLQLQIYLLHNRCKNIRTKLFKQTTIAD